MAGPAPFFTGRHCRWLMIQDNSQVVLDVIKWNVKRRVVKAEDGVNGEKRLRLASYTECFDISVSAKQVDTTALEALLRDIDNEDAGVIPLQKSCGVIVLPPGGRKAAFNAQEVTIDDWDWASGGFSERHDLTIPMRCTKFNKVKSF